MAYPLKTLSGGECATNSVSMASSVPARGASSGPSGLNVGFFNFTLLCCSEAEQDLNAAAHCLKQHLL